MSKPCSQRSKEWRKNHPEKYKASLDATKTKQLERLTKGFCATCGLYKLYKTTRCEKCHIESKVARWRKMGIKDITVSRYKGLLKRQNGLCGICGNPPKNRDLALDHDHKTGKYGKLLCYRCNYGLAFFVWFNQSPERLETTLKYLKRHRATP